MARRISIWSFFVAMVCIASFTCMEARAQREIPVYSVDELNRLLAGEELREMTLANNDGVRYVQDFTTYDFRPRMSPYISVESSAMFGIPATDTLLNIHLVVQMQGHGLWRLDKSRDGTDTLNNTILRSGAEAEFRTSRKATLELMQGSTITLYEPTNAFSRFILESTQVDPDNSVALNLRGTNTIESGIIELGYHSTLGFDLTTANYAEPVLHLIASHPTYGTYGNRDDQTSFLSIDPKFNILGFKFDTGAGSSQGALMHLIHEDTRQYAYRFTYYINYNTQSGLDFLNEHFLVRGESWIGVAAQSDGRLSGTLAVTDPEDYTVVDGYYRRIFHISDFNSKVGVVTWTGNENRNWNATDKNWTGMQAYTDSYALNHTTLPGDRVLFTDEGSGTVYVNYGGVQIGDIDTSNFDDNDNPGMIVESGIYTFVNREVQDQSNPNPIISNPAASLIGIDGPGKVIITAPVRADGSYDLLNAAQVTFRSPNSYWGGTLVENEAKLTLRNTGAVGTKELTLTSGATLTFNIEKTDPTILDADFKPVFYNTLQTAQGTEVIKTDPYDLTLERDQEGGATVNLADTTIENGILRKYIPEGVLSVNLGAAYHTLGFYDVADNFNPADAMEARYRAVAVANRQARSYNRTVAGLRDGKDGGGTVDMDAFRLTIVTSRRSDEFVFSGLITGVESEGFSNMYGGSIYKSGSGVQIFANDQNEYPAGTIIHEGTLVGSFILTDNLSHYRPFGDGIVEIGEGALLAFELTGATPATPTQYSGILHNKITGEGDLQVGFDRVYTVGPDGGSQILHLFSKTSDYTGRTLVNKGKLRVSNVHSTGKTSEVLLGIETTSTGDLRPTALQFVDMSDSSAENPYDRVIHGEGDVEVLLNDPKSLSMTDVFGPTRVYLRSYNYDLTVNADYPIATPLEDRSNYTGRTVVQNGASAEEHTELHLLDTLATGNTSAVVLEGPYSTLSLDFISVTDEDGVELEQVYDRTITGKGNLVKDLEGIVILRENGVTPKNDYEGYTHVKMGTLKLMYAEATGLGVSLGGGPVTIDRDAILELAFDGIYDKDIGGLGILAKSEEGTTTTLGGISTYTGGTMISGGTLSYYNLDPTVPGDLGLGGVTFKNGGGTLQNRGTVLEFSQRVLIHAGSTATFDTLADLTIIGDYGISHVDDEETGEASHLVKKGAGTMTIDTKLVNWTGETVVEEGILKNHIPENTYLTVYAGAEYHTGRSNRIVASLLGEGIVETASGYTFTVNNTGEDVFGGTIIGGGDFVKTNTGTFELTGINYYTGSTLVSGGVLIGGITSGTALTVQGSGEYRAGAANRMISSLQGSGIVDMQGKSLTINQNRTDFTPDFKGLIKNGNWLTKTGVGTQVFSGREYDFSGNVDVREGVLRIGGASTLTYFRTDGDLTIDLNGELALESGGKIDIGKTFDIQGTLSVNLGTGIITAQDVTIASEAVLNVSGIDSVDVETVIIRSANDIQGDFDPNNVYVAGDPSGVDFMEIGVFKSNDQKEILVGQSFVWYRNKDAHGTFTLNDPEGAFNVGISLNDVTGTFDQDVWDGKTLTKRGPGKLILSAVNNYTGSTIVEQGTLKLTNEQATLGSQKIDLVSESSVLELDYDSRRADGSWTDGLTTSITGSGSLYKTGQDSVAVLGGTHDFSGQTFVNQGVLLLDGSSQSRTWVREGAGFGGGGTLQNKLTFEDGSRYYWRFDGTTRGSDHLTVNGSLHIGDNVLFQPVATVTEDKLGNFSGLTVISTLSGVYGRFEGIDAGTNPFYMYELDYSDSRKVKISGFLRDEPLPLSDIVSASLSSAQTRMYRTAYQQIQREWMSDCPHHGHARSGQVVPKRTAWMNFIGRGGDMASSYFQNDYSFQSYGVQAGLSLLSNCTQTAGILFGREENKLSNHSDQVKGEDYYLGFYFGRVFFNGYDVKGYIGGGWQKNQLIRTSNGYRYGTSYDGNTYNTNIEFGRRFLGDRNWLIRPFVGADLNVTWIGGSMEKSLDIDNSNEYRGYGRSDLAQFYLRAGIEATKTWQQVDFRMGTQFRWNVGDSRGSTRIYYPALDGTDARSSVQSYGSELGRFEWGFNFGLNWFLNNQRNTILFIDYDADLFADRPGDPLHGTGTVGFVWRY